MFVIPHYYVTSSFDSNLIKGRNQPLPSSFIPLVLPFPSPLLLPFLLLSPHTHTHTHIYIYGMYSRVTKNTY